MIKQPKCWCRANESGGNILYVASTIEVWTGVLTLFRARPGIGGNARERLYFLLCKEASASAEVAFSAWTLTSVRMEAVRTCSTTAGCHMWRRRSGRYARRNHRRLRGSHAPIWSERTICTAICRSCSQRDYRLAVSLVGLLVREERLIEGVVALGWGIDGKYWKFGRRWCLRWREIVIMIPSLGIEVWVTYESWSIATVTVPNDHILITFDAASLSYKVSKGTFIV